MSTFRANIPDLDQPRVVIVGCGFAGLELAKRLAHTPYQVVIIDKNNHHQFQPLFYQVATAGLEPSSITFPIRKFFRKVPNITLRVAEVLRVLPDEQRIETSVGPVRYDYLVLAMGADTNFYGNANIAAHAIPMKSVSEALYLRNRIFEDFETSLMTASEEERQGYVDVVIVGGGPTGVELAGALAEMRRHILPLDYPEMRTDDIDIILVQATPNLLDGMSKKSGKAALAFLQKLGVDVRLNTRVVDYDGEHVLTDDGQRIATRKLIWAAGIQGKTLEGIPAGSYGPGRRLKVNAYGEVEGLRNVFALGDAALMCTEAYPKGHPQVAQVAIQQAARLGRNFRALLKGKALAAFVYDDKGSMATIGRNLAVVDLPRYHFNGFWAWLLWMFVHLFAISGVKNKLFVFANWVWSYFTYDPSLRLIIRPFQKK